MAGIRKDVYGELETVRRLILDKFPEFDMNNLCVTLGRLGTYHYNKRKRMLLGEERKLYNLLIENSYKPYTVYRWCLLERVPDEIKFQLKNHFVSQKKASNLFFKKKHETELSLQREIKELGLKLIEVM